MSDLPENASEYLVHQAKLQHDTLTSARNDLIKFVEFMRQTGEKDFLHPPTIAHHLVIYKVLQEFATDINFQNLMLLMPPGAGKSVLCTVQFVCWYMLQFPTHSVLCASNTQELSENFNRRRIQAMSTTQYEQLGTQLGKRRNMSFMETVQGGSVSCHGVSGSVVGRRSNLNCCDDPILGSEQAASSTQLAKQLEWYDQDFRSRLVKNGKELMVTTRWSRSDLAGVLINRAEKGEEDWRILRFPLICDDPENDPINRNLGDVLWPEEFTDKRVKHAQRDPMTFQTMYQQLPHTGDGDWLGGDQNIIIKKGNPPIEKMRLVIAADIALTTSGKADFTVFAICGYDEGGYLHVIDMTRERQTPGDSVKTLFKLAQRYPGAHELLIDDDAASKVFKELIDTNMRATGDRIKLSVVPMKMRGLDKETRAANLRALFNQQRVHLWLKEYTPIFVKEAMGFPDGTRHDDMIDAVGLAAKRLAKLGHFTPQPNQPDPNHAFNQYLAREDKDDQGRRMSNMQLGPMFEDREQPKILSIIRNRI